MEAEMFCYQCQEAAKGTGCTVAGNCGKTGEVAGLQDTLLFTLKGLAVYAAKAGELGIGCGEADRAVAEGLFQTITNVNFDKFVFIRKITQALSLRDKLAAQLAQAGVRWERALPEAATWKAGSPDDFAAVKSHTGILAEEDEDLRSLRELITYGIKGLAAYMEHACRLGYEDGSLYHFMHKALASLLDDRLTADDLLKLALECGQYGVQAMALLDQANTATYGQPEITRVAIGVRPNPGILISGHDLKDLEMLLAQSEGTGVDVYTHGEMLPAHYYPAFKKYPHFAGNYGNAWWKQEEEFASFNGPILMTTNCLVPPKVSYKDRVYTTGPVGYPGVRHIAGKPGGSTDFSALIAHAQACPPPLEIECGHIVGGFAHAAVLQLADQIIAAVKSGAVRKFVVMAGCDGRMKSRDYYAEFARKLPPDTVILTAGCAKYKYNKLELGDIGGIPRVLDAGQCNDSYSLAAIALKLKEAFGLADINDLPVAYNISWYEQKAVVVLLALLHLGVKNIHLGPTLPAFLSPNVARILAESFGIGGITTVEDDMKLLLS